jgi:pantetheine-phosphate adenylyltransferase
MSSKKRNSSYTLGVYPGTFDPITLGHLDVVRSAMSICDDLIVAIANDSPKKALFTVKERVEMVKEDIRSYCPEFSKRIMVEGFTGLLMNYADRKKVTVVVRGLRAVSDFEYEFQLASMNSRLNPHIKTVFIPASEETHFIASSLVKEVAKLKGDVSQFVSRGTARKLKSKY